MDKVGRRAVEGGRGSRRLQYESRDYVQAGTRRQGVQAGCARSHAAIDGVVLSMLPSPTLPHTSSLSFCLRVSSSFLAAMTSSFAAPVLRRSRSRNFYTACTRREAAGGCSGVNKQHTYEVHLTSMLGSTLSEPIARSISGSIPSTLTASSTRASSSCRVLMVHRARRRTGGACSTRRSRRVARMVDAAWTVSATAIAGQTEERGSSAAAQGRSVRASGAKRKCAREVVIMNTRQRAKTGTVVAVTKPLVVEVPFACWEC